MTIPCFLSNRNWLWDVNKVLYYMILLLIVLSKRERDEFRSPRINAKFYGWFVIFCAHIRVYRRTRCDTIKCARIFRGIEENPVRDPEASPERMFRVLGAARMLALADTGAFRTKVRNCSSLTESSRRNYTSSLLPFVRSFAFPCLSPRSSRWNLKTTSSGSNSINIACSYFVKRYSLCEQLISRVNPSWATWNFRQENSSRTLQYTRLIRLKNITAA